MKVQGRRQTWIFSVRYRREGERELTRYAVAGPASASTVEAALHLAAMPESVRVEVRSDTTVRKFIDSLLDPSLSGYYAPCPVPTSSDWIVCIGSIGEVLP